MVDKSIYYNNAEDFRDNDTKSYFPLRRHMKSEFFSALNSDHSSDVVDLYEIGLGLNKIKFDDAYFQIGFSEKEKYFVDFLNIRRINE
jgi:hypothetical protein